MVEWIEKLSEKTINARSSKMLNRVLGVARMMRDSEASSKGYDVIVTQQWLGLHIDGESAKCQTTSGGVLDR